MANIELLPCPFCGGKADWGYHDCSHGDYTYCTECGVEVSGTAEMWNKRPEQPPQPVVDATIGQQAVDDVAREKALRASWNFVSKFTSGNSVMRDVRAIAVRSGPTIAQEATSLRDQIIEALAAHGKGG